MGLFRKGRTREGSPVSEQADTFLVQVVGESHYEAELEQLCGGRCRDGHNIATAAVLVANRENPYDANAVEVRIAGLLVGHLARDVAANVSQVLQTREQLQSREVPATITGGWDRGNGDTGHFGVTLQLPSPEHL